MFMFISLVINFLPGRAFLILAVVPLLEVESIVVIVMLVNVGISVFTVTVVGVIVVIIYE